MTPRPRLKARGRPRIAVRGRPLDQVQSLPRARPGGRPPDHVRGGVCTTLATHAWSQGETTYLSLPGTDGWYDVFRTWYCLRCGLHTWATGAVDVTTPPLSPVQWQTQADLQQQHGDVYGGAVRQQEGWERQRRGLSRRLQAGRR